MREGCWFHKRLVLARQWDIYLKSKFESLRTFLPSLFCLGLETKGAKCHPHPPKQVQRLCSAGHTCLEKLSISNCISDFPYIHGNLAVFPWLQINAVQKEWAQC